MNFNVLNNITAMIIDSMEIIKTSDRKYATFDMKMMNADRAAILYFKDLTNRPANRPTS